MKKLREFIERKILGLFIRILPWKVSKVVRNRYYNLVGYRIEKDVYISPSAILIGNVEIEIDKGTYIGHKTLITGGKSIISIGKNCDISSNVTIISGTHLIDPDGERMAGVGLSKDITIKSGVWIGASSTILGGVTIGEMSIIAAGSMVINDIAPYTIVAGNPAIPKKKYNRNLHIWEEL